MLPPRRLSSSVSFPPATLPQIVPCECEAIRLSIEGRDGKLLYGCEGCGRVFFVWWPGLPWWADAATLGAPVIRTRTLPPLQVTIADTRPSPKAPPSPFVRCPNCGGSDRGVGMFERKWTQVGREWQCDQECTKCNRTLAHWTGPAGWVLVAKWRFELWALSPEYREYATWNIA
jgi:hypothetical protein